MRLVSQAGICRSIILSAWSVIVDRDIVVLVDCDMLKPRLSHRWCLSVDEGKTLQARLAGLMERSDRLPTTIGRIAGADVAYETRGNRLYAAVVTLDFETLSILETATHEDSACFPYISGLFSFREIPPLVRALTKLTRAPDLLIRDGQGLAHPRRFGLACHLGVLFGIPTIGCAKSCLIGYYDSPGNRRGDCSLLIHKSETIGAVLRTQDRTKPVFVSIGHRVSLATACATILQLAPSYRLPEPIRQANRLANHIRHCA
jgi:deoxyribonuclease V